MSLWLTVSIWVLLALWSLVEVHGLYILSTNKRAYYTQTSSMVTILWLVFTICWLSFQFIG